MKNFKRLVGLLLCLSMVLSFVPATIVGAAESTGTSTQNTTTSDILEKIDLSGTVVGACSQNASGTDYADYDWYNEKNTSWDKPWQTAVVDGAPSTTLHYNAGGVEGSDYYLDLSQNSDGYTTVDKLVMYHGGTTAVPQVDIVLVLADGNFQTKTFNTSDWGTSADVDPITWEMDQTYNVVGVYVDEPQNSVASHGDIELYHYIEVPQLASAKLNGVDLSKYVIVCDDQCLDYDRTAAEYIQKAILMKTGVRVPIVDDNTSAGEYEIIVGATDRDFSDTLSAPANRAMKFAINAEDTTIAMEADYFIIAGAAYYFVEEYVTKTALGDNGTTFSATVPEGMRELTPITKEANNYIMLIGDGMGVVQTELFEYYDISTYESKYHYSDGEDIFYGYYFPYEGRSRTHNFLKQTTDSGAGGTALATGYKTYNQHIGQNNTWAGSA